MRGLLAANEAFLMFFVADRGSYGFLVRPSALVAYPIALKRAEVAEPVAFLLSDASANLHDIANVGCGPAAASRVLKRP